MTDTSKVQEVVAAAEDKRTRKAKAAAEADRIRREYYSRQAEIARKAAISRETEAIREAAKLLEAEGYELVRKENIRRLSCSSRISKREAESLVNDEHARYVARASVESLVHHLARELKEVAVLRRQDDPECDAIRYTIRLRCIVEDAYPDVRPDQSSTPVKRGLEDIIFEQMRNLGLTARP